MCWSAEVSATFAGLEFLSLCVVLYQVLGLNIGVNKKWIPIFVSVFFVEFSELWLWIDIDNDNTCGVKHTGLAVTSWIKVLSFAICTQPYCCIYWLCEGNVQQYRNPKVLRRINSVKLSRTSGQEDFLVNRSVLDMTRDHTLKEWFFYAFVSLTSLSVAAVLVFICFFSGHNPSEQTTLEVGENSHFIWNTEIFPIGEKLGQNPVGWQNFWWALYWFSFPVCLAYKYQRDRHAVSTFLEACFFGLWVFAFILFENEGDSIWCWTGMGLHIGAHAFTYELLTSSGRKRFLQREAEIMQKNGAQNEKGHELNVMESGEEVMSESKIIDFSKIQLEELSGGQTDSTAGTKLQSGNGDLHAPTLVQIEVDDNKQAKKS